MLRVLTILTILIASLLLEGILRPSRGEDAGIAGPYDRCKTVTDEKLRLKCFDNLLRPKDKNEILQGSQMLWRLLRTPNPQGGREAVSIIRTADTSRSDPDIAGLMVRCGDKAEIEVLIVLLRPLSLRARPMVVVMDGMNKVGFSAKVVAPGELILLPEEASAQAIGPWQHLHGLDIAIEDPELTSHSIIPLEGLAAGLAALRASCPRLQDVQRAR